MNEADRKEDGFLNPFFFEIGDKENLIEAPRINIEMRTNILFLVGSEVLVFCARPRVKKLPTTSSYLAHLRRSSTFCSVSSSSRPKRFPSGGHKIAFFL